MSLKNECQVSKLRGGGSQRLQSADDVADYWLEGTAMKVLARLIELDPATLEKTYNA